MKKNTLDMSLKKFKHVKSTPEATTLRHEDGHILTIAHKTLDSKTKGQLQALSKLSTAYETPDQSNEQRDQKMAQGGQACSCGGKGCMKCSGGMMAQGGLMQQAQQLAPIAAKIAPMLMADGGESQDPNLPQQQQTAYQQAKEFLLGPDWNDPAVNPNHIQVLAGAGPMAGIPGAVEALAPAAEEAGAAASNLQKAGKDVGVQTIGNTDIRPDRGFGKTIVTGARNPAPVESYGKVYTPDMQKTSQIEGAISKYNKKAEGGPVRQMYAEGQDVIDQANQTAGTPSNMSVNPEDARMNSAGMESAPPVERPKLDGRTQATRQIYDTLRATMGSRNGVGPSNTMLFSGIPEGATPEGFDPAIWNQAAQQQAQTEASNSAAISKNNAAIEAKNQALLAAGLPVQQQPIASPFTEMPGTPNKPNQPNPSVMPNMDASGKPLPQEDQGIPQDIQGGENTLIGAFGQQQAGNTSFAQAETEKGGAEALVQENAAQLDADLRNRFADAYNSIDAELHAHQHDVEQGYIDPEKYWTGDKDGNGSHSKIMAGIGMVLAGFNPANQPNAAIQFLNNQINRNVEAQAKNLEAKQNLVRANLQQFSHLSDAATNARLMMLQAVQHQMGAVASKYAGPEAQARAQIANGQIQQLKGQEQMNFAMRKMMFDLAGDNRITPDRQVARYTRAIQIMNGGSPEQQAQAKMMESHVVPGVGIARGQAVPEATKQNLVAARQVNDLINQARQLSEMSSDPAFLKLPPAQQLQARFNMIQQGKVIQSSLLTAVKQSNGDGVYKPSDANFIMGQLGWNPGNPASWITAEPRLRQLQQSKAREYGIMAKGAGIDNYQPMNMYKTKTQMSQEQQAQDWLAKNPNHPKAASVRQKLQGQ